MKIRHSLVALSVLTASALLPPVFAQTATPQSAGTGPENSAAPSQSELNKMAQQAYIFAYPLVMNYRTMYAQAIKNGGFGQWLHLGVSSPEDKDIVTPNIDSPYSYVWLDLRSEPWVLTLPKIEKERFYTSQWDDLWGYVLDNPGSVNDGNDGVTVMLASPDWKGEKPEGVDRIIRGESDFLGSLTRTQLMGDKSDLNRVKEIQHSYQLQPLSSYLGQTKPTAAPEINFPAWEEGAENTPKYWEYVAFLLKYVNVNPVDQGMYQKLKMLGLTTDGNFDAIKLSAAQKKALEEGVSLGRKQLKEVGDKTKDAGKLFATRDVLKEDYLTRAIGVYLGIFGNTTDQSFYYSLGMDDKGQPLDASKHDYVIKMRKDALPPVKYFWSLTMYSLPQRLLVANEDKRYSYSNTTPDLKKGSDGSVTFYLSAKRPSDKTVNWLPAPDGPFWTVLRTYGPDKSILDGAWKAPEVKVVR